MSQNFWYPPGSASATSVIANQGTPNTNANGWPVKVTDGTDVLAVNGDGSINVVIASGLANPLPVQDSAAEASLASIDTKLTNPLPVSVSGVATEATLSAFSNKTASAAVHEAFDYQSISYVGATTDIDVVVYKSGGSGGTTVATLTMGYDGSNRLTSVTKT